MKFAHIDAEKAVHSVAMLCRILGVSRSGYYAWTRREPSRRSKRDAELRVRLRAHHRASRGTYGAPRLHADLQAEGARVGRKRVARLMREDGLQGRSGRKRVRTTYARPDAVGADLVKRTFQAEQPNRLWAADTTYLRSRDGFLFLVAILDLFSRRAVGWAVGSRLDAELSRSALSKALVTRRPDAGLVFHSDRGSEFTAGVFTSALAASGAHVSLSRPGNCYDNAPVESFWGTLKLELGINDGRVFESKEDARAVVGEYIERFYNRRRRHSTLGYASPVDYETAAREEARAA